MDQPDLPLHNSVTVQQQRAADALADLGLDPPPRQSGLIPPGASPDEAARVEGGSGRRALTPGLAAGRVPSYISDHRARLRERFLQGGAEALPDYEMLELVLFRAIPRQDVKPLARRLMDRFGDLGNVLSAPNARLLEVAGVGPAVICELRVVEAAAHRLARSRVIGRHVVSSWSQLLDYCRTVMAHRGSEQFRVLYLDRKNMLIADEQQAEGTVDHVPVYPREVMKRALELDASALILVHNHPSGDPSPSPEDIAMTKQIDAAARALGLTLHDHIIVGRGRELSFRAAGLMEEQRR